MQTNVLLSHSIVIQVLGEARLKRLQRGGWLARQPDGKYKASDIRAVVRRFERGSGLDLPPDTIESQRTNDSRRRHGHAYVKKAKEPSIFDADADVRKWL